MKIVALASGGKDSTYAMMKCVEHGHEIVALANLYPPQKYGEEMDSFMYQTVGHASITSIADAMQLPLFRREITGSAVVQGLRYSTEATPGDEVEDLHALLSEVVSAMPEVNAVCAGAILSNYQRSRVEAVCERLGLTSLAYLWQREQGKLLDEMISAGVSAIVVKVCSLGLKASHLGRTIGELRAHFHRLHDQFGFHICGEGGEYETFTLDCPLYKHRLKLSSTRVIDHGAGVSLLCLEAVAKAAKDANVDASAIDSQDAARADPNPGSGDDDNDRSQLPVANWDATATPTWRVGRCGVPRGGRLPTFIESPFTTKVAYEAWLSRALSSAALSDGVDGSPSNVVACSLGAGLFSVATYGSVREGSAPAQLTAALGRVRAQLSSAGLGLDHVILLKLYVADMREYAAINAAFSAFFCGSAPAARVAVQLPLAGQSSGGVAARCEVAVEVLAWSGSKQFLHVQSISEWAPRMIGPYCQLTIGFGVAYVAGSLGLRAASMTLTDGGARAQTYLSLRNCAATLRGLHVGVSGALGLIVYIVDTADARGVLHEAICWLRRATGQHDASADELPPVLLLQVRGSSR